LGNEISESEVYFRIFLGAEDGEFSLTTAMIDSMLSLI
jgi:hypothetical protein